MVSFLRDKQFFVALGLALPVWAALWLFAPTPTVCTLTWRLWLLAVLAYPLVEEIVFRGGLQPWLYRYAPQMWRGISAANVYTSIVFTALHFATHPPVWALAVFVPSLVYGYFRDRHRAVAPAVILHMVYNAGFFALFPPL